MTTRNVSIRVQTEGKADVKRDFQDVGQSGASAHQAIAQAADKATAAQDRQMAKWKQLAAAAKEAEAIQERQARFNAILGVSAGGGKSAADSAAAFLGAEKAAGGAANRRGLTRAQQQTLVYTASDIFASAASGMSPGLIAMQQGPQVLQAFAVQGNMALGTMVKLGLAVGGVAAAVGAATAAWMSHENAMRKMDVVAHGLAASAGLSAEQMDRLAGAAAEAGDVTVGASREMAAAYLSTGRIGGEVTEKLIALTKRYAVATGQDAKDATKELAAALADPARGYETLNEKLRFLDDSTVRHIQSLLAQNKLTEAQTVLTDALGARLVSTASNVNILAGAWEGVRQKASAAWDAMGKAISWMAGNQNDLQRLAELDARRAMRPAAGAGMFNVTPAWWGAEDKEASEIRARLAASQKAAETARLNTIAADARGAQDRISPDRARLRQLEQDRAKIQAGITSGALSNRGEANGDLAKLDREIAAVKAGYASAAAQAAALKTETREAGEAARKAAAEARKHAEEVRRLSDLELRNKLELAKVAGDKSLTAELERQLRIRQLSQEFEAGGLTNAKARAAAEHQVGLEMQAWFTAWKKDFQDQAKDLVTMADQLKGVSIVYDANERALGTMKEAGERAFDVLADKLAYGSRAWGSWKDAALDAIGELTAEMTRLAVLNPLKNWLFGQDNPTASGGFLKSVAGAIGSAFGGGFGKSTDADWAAFANWPRNANGTDNWRGGPTWVGERGPELVNLPAGAQVLSNARSAQMGGVSLTVHVHAEGAVLTEEVKGWVQAGVRDAVRESGAAVLPIVNEGISRGHVR